MPNRKYYEFQSWDLIPVSKEEKTFDLLVPKGARVRAVQLEVSGEPHTFWENLMDPKKGATVTPFEADTGDGWKGLVVDFHALRATNYLRIKAIWTNSGSKRYCRLQAWAGITWHQPEPMESYVLELLKNEEMKAGFPELEVQKLMLSFHNSDPPTDSDAGSTMLATTLTQLELSCRSVPSNLPLRIGDGPPFWTHYGPLAKALKTPDFAGALNEYLASDVLPEGEQEHRVPLTIRSDTLGQVRVSLVTFDYFYVVDRFADNAAEKTLTFACQGPWTQTVEFELRAEAEVQKATVNLSGTFADDRFIEGYRPMDAAVEEYAAMVSPDYWPAQEIVLAESVTLAGVDLCLARLSEKAELTVEVQSDVNQAPSGAALATAELSLDPTTGEACWYCLALPSPAELAANKSYWLVLKGKEGQASWQARSGEAELKTLSYSKDEGISWASYDLTLWGRGVKMAGQFRLRHLPSAYSLPIVVSAGTDNNLSLEKVDSSVDFRESLAATGKALLSITAKSEGQLTLSNLRIEYGLVKPSEEEIRPGPLAEQGVQIIDGVGLAYAERLREVGVETLTQLAELDLSLVQVDVPTVRLQEFQRKAEMALSVEIEATTFTPLLDLTVSEVLRTPVVQLSDRARQPMAVIRQLRRNLITLQVALDNAFLDRMTLRDLTEV